MEPESHYELKRVYSVQENNTEDLRDVVYR